MHLQAANRQAAARPNASARRAILARTAQVDRSAVNSGCVTDAVRSAFKRDGFVLLSGVFSDQELAKELDQAYFELVKAAPEVDSAKESTLVNIMQPSQKSSSWKKGNVVEERGKVIAQELLGAEVELDFDQILAKRPKSRDSGMPWHQDAAHWPEELMDEEACTSGTANVWVAVSDVPVESGCMRYVPGSHLEPELRPHQPVDGPVLKARVGGERAVMVPMKRGDVLIHHERVVHGSGPNLTGDWRCGYVLNFKSTECLVEERALGVTHT